MNKYQCEKQETQPFIICPGCLEAMKNRHDTMIKFIEEVSNMDMGYPPIAKQANKILKEIGELDV